LVLCVCHAPVWHTNSTDTPASSAVGDRQGWQSYLPSLTRSYTNVTPISWVSSGSHCTTAAAGGGGGVAAAATASTAATLPLLLFAQLLKGNRLFFSTSQTSWATQRATAEWWPYRWGRDVAGLGLISGCSIIETIARETSPV
jgi:hypothetical protein